MNDSANKQLPDPVARHHDRILELAEKWGASNVRVYGSVVRGSADAGSDIDILVDLEPDRTLLDLGGLQMALQRLLDRPVDLKTQGFLREEIRNRVEDEAIHL